MGIKGCKRRARMEYFSVCARLFICIRICHNASTSFEYFYSVDQYHTKTINPIRSRNSVAYIDALLAFLFISIKANRRDKK